MSIACIVRRLSVLIVCFACVAARPPIAASAAAPAAKAPVPHAAAGTDTLLTRHLIYYDLYAPTAAQISSSGQDVLFTLDQLSQYIGERAPRVVFVTFASDAERARYDVRPVVRHELPIVEYVGSVSSGAPRSEGASVADAQKRAPRSLSHQAAHAFFYGYVQSQLRRRGEPVDSIVPKPNTEAARGAEPHRLHPRIPDWFDEALAGMCEAPSMRGIRLKAMGQSLDRRIPFPEFFSMPMPQSPPERVALFSNQAFTLGTFIAATEGDRFLGNIAVGLIEGKYIGQCLLDATKLYSKPEALETQYVAWLRAQTGTTSPKP